MWHLILPPIIIVVGLGTILWYLSRRLHEPSVLSGIERAKGMLIRGSEKRALRRKAFFLKLLERIASYFKTTSLRIHNFFQFSLERLREHRKAIDAARLIEQEEIAKKESAAKASEEEMPTSEPALEPRATISSESFVVEMKDSVPSKPILSEKITRPEQVKTPKDDQREEELIERIAENPRDTVAYEELGDYYFAMRNMKDAKSCYRQSIKLHPTNRAVKIKIRRLEKFFEKGEV